MSRSHENHNNKTDAEEIERLIAGFSPMIKKKLRNTSFQEREDLEQELKIKIFEKADMLLCQEAPGFWEFIIEYMEEN
ncbi:sigma-O factor regulator RsoA [Bacillus atrophaeus]|uniref:sigma-O factor regulator RsoA n=1 Tax=Bacillus atrophaeus TaxID=1452 RepID=UPI003D23FDDD